MALAMIYPAGEQGPGKRHILRASLARIDSPAAVGVEPVGALLAHDVTDRRACSGGDRTSHQLAGAAAAPSIPPPMSGIPGPANRAPLNRPPSSSELSEPTLDGIRRTLGIARDQKAPATGFWASSEQPHRPFFAGGHTKPPRAKSWNNWVFVPIAQLPRDADDLGVHHVARIVASTPKFAEGLDKNSTGVSS
jgi:hypothetical protein